MEAMVPVLKEKEITPKSIKAIENIFSSLLYAVMSPYPTVTRVVTVK